VVVGEIADIDCFGAIVGELMRAGTTNTIRGVGTLNDISLKVLK
jgi:hypothetical protein